MNMMSAVPPGQPTCVTCRFHTLEQFQGHIQRQMVCRKSPPLMNMVTTPQGVQAMTLFPVVQANIWCFSHEPKPIALFALLDVTNDCHDADFAEVQVTSTYCVCDVPGRAIEGSKCLRCGCQVKPRPSDDTGLASP